MLDIRFLFIRPLCDDNMIPPDYAAFPGAMLERSWVIYHLLLAEYCVRTVVSKLLFHALAGA